MQFLTALYYRKRDHAYNHFRLALYVYEYLLHVGAQKAAQTFLNEVNCFDIHDGLFIFSDLWMRAALKHG